MIGKVIQEKRKEQGLTQAQLAEYLGVTAPAVNRWEKDLSVPDASLLAPLARLLKTDINTLFSFYDSLSDEEREIFVDRARLMFFNQPDVETFAFIDGLLKENLSDGALYRDMAGMVYGLHIFRKSNDPHIYLDKVVAYYERALELLPDQAEDISHSLVSIYGELGDLEKAEAALARIPDRKIDKKWSHAELLYVTGMFDQAIPELKEAILRRALSLVSNLQLLRDALSKAGNSELSSLADEKAEQLRRLFELWDGFDVVSQLDAAVASGDAESQKNHILAMLEASTDGSISNSPLFSDVKLGGASPEDKTAADTMAEILDFLKQRKANSCS